MQLCEPTIDKISKKTMAARIVGTFLGRHCEVVGSRPMSPETMFIAAGNHRIVYVNFTDGLEGYPTSMQIIDSAFYRVFQIDSSRIAAEFEGESDPQAETVKIKHS